MHIVFHVTRRLLVALSSGIVIFAVALALFWLLMGGWLATRMSSLANQHVFQDRTTRLHVGRITGSLFTNVIFEDVRLERQIAGEWRSAVYAGQLEARYDVWALLHGHSELKEVRVWQPLIEISEDSTGRWVLPVGNIPGDRTGARKQLLFSDVEIIDGKFRLIGRKRGWEAYGLDAKATLRVDGEKVDLSLERAAFTMLDPVGQVKELSGELHVDGRRIKGDQVRLFWEGSSLVGNFAWDSADSLHGLRVKADMLRIPLGRFKGLLDADALPDSGYVSGGIRLDGSSRGFDFEAGLSGQYEHWQVDSLQVTGWRDAGHIRVDRLGLAMPEAHITSGEGAIDLARGGRLEASVRFEHLQVDSIPLKAVKWIPGVARGSVDLDITGFRKGYGPLTAGVDVDLQGERAFGIELAGARGRVDFVQGRNAEISGIVLTLPDGGEVTGEGFVAPGDILDFDFTATTGDWSQLSPVIVIPGLRGSGRASGKLIGTGRSPVLDLSGDFTNVTGWEMAADSVRLERLYGPFLPEAEFEGTLEAMELHAIGRVIDHVDMDFQWREPRLTFPRLQATDNDTLVVTSGWADFDPPRRAMTTTLEGGSLTVGALEWTPDGPVVVEGRGTAWTVNPRRFRSPAGDAIVEASFETVDGTMDALFTDMRIDLAVMAGEEKPPEFGGGLLSGTLRLKGPIALPDPSGRLMFHDYRWAAAVVDSALFDFEVMDRRLELRSGWADAGDGRLSFAGGADLPDHGWTVWNRWRNKEPIDWPRLVLDNAEVWTDGVPLERWAAWNPELKDLAGRVSGRARVSAALAAPEMQFSGRILNGRRGAYEADTVEVAGAYGPDRLLLDRLRIVRKDAVSIVSGDLPLRASIAPAKAELLDEPMHIDIDLPRSDLAVLPLLSPMIESAAGSLTGRVQLRGTPKRYLVYGGLELAGGRLQMRNREEVVDHIEAEVRFDSTTVSLISLSARQDSSQAAGSRLTGHGTFELGAAPERAYKLEIDLTRFVMRQSADYAARFDGHLEIVPLRLADGNVRPMMIGDIRLDRAEIVREFDQPQPVTEPGEAFFYSLSIDAPRGIFVVNDDVDMELAGTLTARRTPDRSEMIGDLEILRGTYTLLLRRFRIVNGRLNFNRVDVIDPEIDITAETNERDFIITVHLSGQASNPVIEFAARNSQGENITKNNDEILRLLAPGGALAGQLSDPGSNNSNINDLLGSVQLLFSEVQRDLARKLGVDEIRVDAPGPDDAFDVEEDGPKGPNSYGRVGVSKWITPDVSVSVSRGLSGTQANDLAVEYRLGRLLFLRGEIISRLYEVDRSSDDRRDEEYNVDLKFWYEY